MLTGIKMLIRVVMSLRSISRLFSSCATHSSGRRLSKLDFSGPGGFRQRLQPDVTLHSCIQARRESDVLLDPGSSPREP